MFHYTSLLTRAQLFVACLAFCVGIPAVLLGTALIYERTKVDTLQSLTERAPLVVQLIENDITAKEQALAHAASQFQAKKIEDIDQEALDRVVKGFSGVVWAGVADRQGNVRLAHKDLLKGADVTKRPWFQNGLKGPSVLDRHDAVLLAKLLPVREQPYRFIDVAVPIHSIQGETLGVLALHIDWSWYQSQFPGLLGEVNKASEVAYSVWGSDRSIRLLNASAQNAGLIAEAEQADNPDEVLNEHFYVVKAEGAAGGVLDTLRWNLLIMQRKDVTHSSVVSAAVFAVLSFLVGLLASSSLYLWMASKVSTTSRRFVDALIARDEETLSEIRPQLPSEIVPLSTKAEKLINDLRTKRGALEDSLSKAQSSYLEIHQLIAQAPVAIAMFDDQMRYLAYSNLWLSQYLNNVPNPLGQCHYDLIPDMPECWRLAHKAGLGGETVRKESDSWTDDTGARRWLNWTVQPWRSAEGAVEGLIIITEDVTEANRSRLALERSEERFQLAMQGSHDGLWDWDVETHEVYFSHSWKTMLGYTPDELENSFDTWERLVHPDDLQGSMQILQSALQRKGQTQFSNSFRLAHKDGHWVKVLSRGLIVRDADGNPRRLVGTHLDRTEVESLQHELEEAWVIAQAEAKSNETKSRFLATVSHEIRNPLNSVCGFARLIRDDSHEPEIKHYAQLMMQTTDALTLVLNDLLDFAKIDAGKMEIHHEPFNLSSILEELSESSTLLCREKNVVFEFTKRNMGGEHFIGDAGRIRQVVQNLLSNAIKFTGSGQVTLRLITSVNQTGTPNVLIEVEDTGIGIAADNLDGLFKPFSQMHKDASNIYGGTGLGLAIVKAITEMMYGTVQCRSTLGVGTCFSIGLKLTPTDKLSDGRKSSETLGPTRCVLVADDSSTNQRVLSKFLQKRGHEVVCASDGITALAGLRQQRFDFALLDMDMPGLTGQEVVAQSMMNPGASNGVRFACLSGHISREISQGALSAGFERFFTKPLDLDEILEYLATTSPKGTFESIQI